MRIHSIFKKAIIISANYIYFIKHRKYMKKGRYYTLPNLRTFMIADSNYNISTEGNNPKRKIMLKLCWIFNNSRLLTVKKEGELFNASILYLSNNNKTKKNVRLFSPDKKEVLTFISSKQELKTITDAYDFIYDNYPVPERVDINIDKMCYKEKFIESKNRLYWNNDDFDYVYKFILQHYSEYYKSQKKQYIDDPDPLGIINKATSFISLKQFLMDHTKNSDTTPCYFQHGDLSTYNILLANGRKCYWIDWEHAGIYPFYIDLFFCVFYELIQKSNYFLFDRILKGFYDIQLNLIYEIVGIKHKDHLYWIDSSIVHILNRMFKNFGDVSLLNIYLKNYLRLTKYVRN